MIICKTKATLTKALQNAGSIGFVPTMGALHEGHLALVRRAKKENDLVCVSIFVNPIQFNNPEDLKKYPRDLDKDSELLKSAGCDVLFAPEVDEMYPDEIMESYRFGDLESVMEGRFRPGHFHGVAVVVKRLFDLVNPQKAYFGEKDYQQLQIIKTLVAQTKLPVEIIPCEIVREKDGLAMSSRNMLLSDEERRLAPLIYKTLRDAVDMSQVLTIEELKAWVEEQLHRSKYISLEYFEIADAETLQPVLNLKESNPKRAFITAYLGKVRLIDNMAC